VLSKLVTLGVLQKGINVEFKNKNKVEADGTKTRKKRKRDKMEEEEAQLVTPAIRFKKQSCFFKYLLY
jgi:hypothetical protein